MGLTEFLAQYIPHFIHGVGYPGVFVLMCMESMVFPLPSEAVMPFAGFLIVGKFFTFWHVVLASTLGSLAGSLLSYWAGYYGGMPFVKKFGRYLLLNAEDLQATEKFFKKYGDGAIFICRFIPVVRHLISIPAGTGKMNLLKFSIFTIIGAGIWNAFLTKIGMLLKDNWEIVMKYSRIIDFAVALCLLALAGLFVYRHVKKTPPKVNG